MRLHGSAWTWTSTAPARQASSAPAQSSLTRGYSPRKRRSQPPLESSRSRSSAINPAVGVLAMGSSPVAARPASEPEEALGVARGPLDRILGDRAAAATAPRALEQQRSPPPVALRV